MDFDAGSFVFDERKLYNKIGKFITGKGQYIGKSFDDISIYASIVMHYG